MSVPKNHWLNEHWQRLSDATPQELYIRRRQFMGGYDLVDRVNSFYFFGALRQTGAGVIYAETLALTGWEGYPHFRKQVSSWDDGLEWLLHCHELWKAQPPDTPPPGVDHWRYGRVYELSADSLDGRLVYVGQTHSPTYARILDHIGTLTGRVRRDFYEREILEPGGFLRYECRLLGTYADGIECTAEECRYIAESHANPDVICVNKTSGNTSKKRSRK